MQIQKVKSKRKLYIVISIVVVLLVAAAGVYFFLQKPEPESFINTDKPTDEQIDAGLDAKDATVKNSSRNTGNLETNETEQAPVAGSTPQISITAAAQNGSLVQIRSIIPKVTTNGLCELTINNGQNTITKTTGVQALADSSTCQGFDVSTSEFASGGTWTATLIYKDTSGKTEASEDVVVNK